MSSQKTNVANGVNTNKVNIGIDIGTTAIKALAVDESGAVVAKVRERCNLAPDRLEHDARLSWHEGVLGAWGSLLGQLKNQGNYSIAGVCAASMVPSLTGVDDSGIPLSPGLLYQHPAGGNPAGPPTENREFYEFLKWTKRNYPEARGFYPAQGVATAALSGKASIDSITALCASPVFSEGAWSSETCQELEIETSQLPQVAETGEITGEISGKAAKMAAETGFSASIPVFAGTVDAFCEMSVSAIKNTGDVLIILGSTLVSQAVLDSPMEGKGLWNLPFLMENGELKWLVGGPSNAGGLFISKVRELFGISGENVPGESTTHKTDPSGIPVWLPYICGERTPFHDPTQRAGLYGLEFNHTQNGIMRAAYEASAFVVRRNLELAEVNTKKIMVTGGGCHQKSWIKAFADCMDICVDAAKIPEGGALGAAWLAAGQPNKGEWASKTFQVEPDKDWTEHTQKRYEKFISLH